MVEKSETASSVKEPLVKIMKVIPWCELQLKSDEEILDYYKKLQRFQRLGRVEKNRILRASYRQFLRKKRELAGDQGDRDEEED